MVGNEQKQKLDTLGCVKGTLLSEFSSKDFFSYSTTLHKPFTTLDIMTELLNVTRNIKFQKLFRVSFFGRTESGWVTTKLNGLES